MPRMNKEYDHYIGIRASKETVKALEALAKNSRMNTSQFIRELIRAALKNKTISNY